jgi:hypothetical protein
MCTPPELLGKLSKLTTPDTYTVSAAAAGLIMAVANASDKN